jgi:HAD superfamily hydrolase (TIGR01509 family)
MDGVLLDSESLIREVFLDVSREHGFDIPQEIFLKMVGRNQVDSRKVLEEYAGATFPWEKIRLEVDRQTGHRTNEYGWPKKPYVDNALSGLKDLGIRLCVATSTAKLEAKKRLGSASLIDYFEEVTGGDEVSLGKPNPDIFLLAVTRLGVGIKECLIVEDSEFGILAATRAGIASILVPDLKQPTSQTVDLTLGVLDDLSAVLEFVKGL